jgi:uncharacterized protein GlcG (DUF336 family)
MTLTLADAQRVLEATLAKAASLGVNLSVAVVDGRGDLVAFSRMDGARFFTANVARGKAQASATFGVPSSQLQEMAGVGIYEQISQWNGGGFVFYEGAVPLLKDGTVVGAVGASGASGEDDEAAAGAGAAAL